MVIITVSIAVSVVALVSFRCFDGSVGFVPVFRWFRWFRSDGFVSVFWVLVHADAFADPVRHFAPLSKQQLMSWDLLQSTET